MAICIYMYLVYRKKSQRSIVAFDVIFSVKAATIQLSMNAIKTTIRSLHDSVCEKGKMASEDEKNQKQTRDGEEMEKEFSIWLEEKQGVTFAVEK